MLNSAPHDHNLLYPKKGFGILGRGNREIRQGPDGDNRNTILLILPQDIEHHLVRRLQRRREERMLVLDCLQRSSLFRGEVFRPRLEERLPCFCGGKMGMLGGGCCVNPKTDQSIPPSQAKTKVDSTYTVMNPSQPINTIYRPH